jgi:predicted dehydrogenase
MRSLVVGYGSIGARHARILRELGCPVAIVSRHAVGEGFYKSLPQALAEHRPEYVVVATPTAEHAITLESLAHHGFDGWVLVEKPLFDSLRTPPQAGFKGLFVGYNLRFHPVLCALREHIADARVVSAQVYVGQYLPHWRPGTDYRQSYSASRQAGGGVLRDLSHELDYVYWIFGRWQRLAASGGHLSALEISSDDVFSILMNCDRCAVLSLSLNYLDTVHQRHLTVNLDGHTLIADLIRGTLQHDADVTTFSLGRDDTYVSQHQAMLAGRHHELCSLEDGLETLHTIESAERGAATRSWICR